MNSSDPVCVTTKVNVEQDSHLMRLPTEVREMIYRPLLIAKYTRRELSMTSKEYDYNRRSIQSGRDQTYHFDTAILATSRTIHTEARDLCRRENDFVCLTSREPSRLGYELGKFGLQMIAKGSKARRFWNISMSLRLDPVTLRGWPQNEPDWSSNDGCKDVPEDGRPWNYIFCSYELPEFCRLILKVGNHDECFFLSMVLYIDINAVIGNGQAPQIDSTPAGLARLRRLLYPLRQLHNLGAAQLDGPISGSYKGYIIRSVCDQCPTAMDIVHKAMVFLDLADEQASNGQFRQALLGFKAARSLLGSCGWRYGEFDIVMDDGPFPGLEARKVVLNMMVRLQARVAAVYLRSEKLRMARIYTERALDPRRTYDHRHNKVHTVDIQPWEYVVYAEVLHVAAKISYTHGDVYEAMGSLAQARGLVAFNEEQELRYEEWQAHSDRLRARRARHDDAKRREMQAKIEKSEGIENPDNNTLSLFKRKKLTHSFVGRIQVVSNWKTKGDRLLRNGRSILAAFTYQTALHKLELITHNCYIHFTLRTKTFQGYSAVDAIAALTFKLQAGLAAAYLMSRKYKEVDQLTDSALRDEDQRYRYRSGCHSERDHAGQLNLDFQRLNYCKALSLKHMGRTTRAIEHMEKALSFDPGDGTVFAQLGLLKQQRAEAEATARQRRMEKLNGPQIRLRKKQANRRISGAWKE